MWDLLLGIGGALLGQLLIPIPGLGAAIGWAVGSTIGSFISGTDTVVTKGPRLEDLKVQVSSYGVDIPKVYGTVRVAGNVFFAAELEEERKIRHLDGDAEFWEYRYYANFAVGLCEGPIIGVRRIWLNGKLFMDLSSGVSYDLFSSIQRGGSGNNAVIIYKGTETQTADGRIQDELGAANTPAYRGLAYIMFRDLRLDNYGNRIPEVTAEVVASGTESGDDYTISLGHGVHGIKLTPDGNMIIANLWDDTIYIYEGVSTTLITSFTGPWVDAPGPSNYLRSVAVYNGDLYSFWFYNASSPRVSVHNGISSSIKETYNLQYTNISSSAQDIFIYGGFGYICARNRDLINKYSLPDWTLISSFPTFGTSNASYSIGVDSDGNMLQSNTVGDRIYRRSGISGAEIDYITMPGDYFWFYYERNSDILIAAKENGTVTLFEGFSNTIIQTGTITLEDETLDEIVEGICTDAGLSTADIDTTALQYDTVKGYVRASTMPARRALEPLMKAYQFDGAEVDHKLVFVKRGATDFVDECDSTQTFADKWDKTLSHSGTIYPAYSSNEMRLVVVGSSSRGYASQCMTVKEFVLYNHEWSIKFEYLSNNDWWNDNLDLSEAKVEIVPVNPSSKVSNDFYELEEGFAGNGAKISLNLRTNTSGKITLREYYGGSANQLLNEDFTYAGSANDEFELVVNTCENWAKLYGNGQQIGSTVNINPLITDVIGSKFVINVHWHNYATQKEVYFDNFEFSGVAIIPEEDLAAHEYGKGEPKKLTVTRSQEADVPREYVTRFISDDRDYQDAAARSIRMSIKGNNRFKVELPIVMSFNYGKQIAEVLHNMAVTERVRYGLSTFIKYLFIAPSDSIEVDGYRARAESISIMGGVLQIEGPAERDDNYTSSASTDDPTFTDQTLAGEGVTSSVLLDMPVLSDLHDNAGFYIAVYGLSSGWSGAVVYISTDGSSYAQSLSIMDASIVGTTIDALADAGVARWDRGNTVTVRMATSAMSLSSATEAQVLNRVNWAAIGAHGAWEIIGFADVTDNGDGTYTLGTLLRGLRGTEEHTGGHAAGNGFVMLDLDITTTDGGDLGRLSLGQSSIGVEQYYKVISLHTNPDARTGVAFTNQAVGLKPYAPTDVRGSRDGSNNLTITWKRSGRISNGWDDYGDVPLGESSEAYEVDVMDPDSTEEVLRTIEVTSETASYTAAQQTADGITPGDDVTVRVYQISAAVDRGYMREATI